MTPSSSRPSAFALALCVPSDSISIVAPKTNDPESVLAPSSDSVTGYGAGASPKSSVGGPTKEIKSIRHPLLATDESVPSLHRSRTLWFNEDAGRLTEALTYPPESPVQACLPLKGLPLELSVWLYPEPELNDPAARARCQ